MTHPDDWDKIFPQERGPKHYKNFKVHHLNLYQRMN